jgi:hypothetical protein
MTGGYKNPAHAAGGRLSFGCEKAMQRRKHKDEKNRRPAPSAAASQEPPSSARLIYLESGWRVWL